MFEAMGHIGTFLFGISAFMFTSIVIYQILDIGQKDAVNEKEQTKSMEGNDE